MKPTARVACVVPIALQRPTNCTARKMPHYRLVQTLSWDAAFVRARQSLYRKACAAQRHTILITLQNAAEGLSRAVRRTLDPAVPNSVRAFVRITNVARARLPAAQGSQTPVPVVRATIKMIEHCFQTMRCCSAGPRAASSAKAW